MKKTVISVLLVLLLSFVVLGCGGEEDPAELSDDAKSAINALGVNPDWVILPDGCTFLGYAKEVSILWDGVYIYWSGADIAKFNDYKAKWAAAPDRAVIQPSNVTPVEAKLGCDDADISFIAADGVTEATTPILNIPAGSIQLYIQN